MFSDLGLKTDNIQAEKERCKVGHKAGRRHRETLVLQETKKYRFPC